MPMIEKTVLSLWSYFGAFVENQLNMNVRVDFGPHSIPFIFMSILMQGSRRLDYCCFVSIISFKIERVNPPALSSLFKLVLATLGPLKIYMNFRSSLSISTKKSAGILIRIALDWFGEQYHVSTSTLRIHECNMSFRLFNFP